MKRFGKAKKLGLVMLAVGVLLFCLWLLLRSVKLPAGIPLISSADSWLEKTWILTVFYSRRLFLYPGIVMTVVGALLLIFGKRNLKQLIETENHCGREAL